MAVMHDQQCGSVLPSVASAAATARERRVLNIITVEEVDATVGFSGDSIYRIRRRGSWADN
ncbi:uncharacterized protein PHACADRAFT_202716 [Phanerochaete carnosa HHB-10118-sp]|uniref:Uncharacterized protein n=1 Tax=Phanerochaete carnosa (strain HHB-10118-sp) TaxID=650164 RepID=K5WEA8_PHACS|nr:uncharacterized protein PHACADRAFT_202716 [Phanerochaete carnosa HHB-10118-sp]EKM48517.1 hypothetical protein PHACADRAFT_202716 [Phanerochaete carnosa HHB-10118-sp]